MSEATDCFTIIQEMTCSAQASWAVWLELHRQHKASGPYTIALQIHDSLFDAVSNAQIHYVFLILSDLYGIRKDVHTFDYLVSQCLGEKRIDGKRATECRKLIEGLKRHSKEVRTLHNNYFGHKRRISTDEILGTAHLRFRDIDEMFAISFLILSRLSFGCGVDLRDRSAFEERVKDDVVAILKHLQEDFTCWGETSAAD